MSTKKVKVAIIEDDIAIVQMYRTKFENEGYDVATAPDGATGLELIESFEPDIILLDLMMPNMNGLDMLSRLRSQPGGRDAKVVVLTNMGDTETATRVYKMAADDYIVKAEMTPKQVAERVKALLAKGSGGAAPIVGGGEAADGGPADAGPEAGAPGAGAGGPEATPGV